MLALILFAVIASGAGGEQYEVVATNKRITLEADDHMFGAPRVTLNHDDNLYLVDNKELVVWKYNYTNDHFLYFSGKGEGPGELRDNIISAYVSSDELIVLNANGAREDVFSLTDGALINAKRTQQPALLFREGSTLIFKKGGKFVLQFDGDVKAEAPVFSATTYGFTTHCSRFGAAYFIVASLMSNNNTIPYVIFDLKAGTVAETSVIKKRQEIQEDTLPPRIKQGLAGVDMSKMFFNNFQVITTQSELGFLINEYSMGIYEDARRGHFSVIHAINPATGKRKLLTLYHKGINQLSFIIPGKDQWLAFNAARNELLFLEVKKTAL